MAVLYTNKATSTLLSAITSADTTITVASGHGSRFPAPSNGNYFFVTVEDFSTGATEVMKVTARLGDSMTVERGFDFTTAAAFNAGVTVELRVSAAMLDAIKRDAISDVPLTDGTGAFGNWDINVLGTAKKWDRPRRFRVGNSDRYVDGSIDVEWALADIGALALTGGTLTGGLNLSGVNDSTSKVTLSRSDLSHTLVVGANYIGTFSNSTLEFYSNSAFRGSFDASGNFNVSGGAVTIQSAAPILNFFETDQTLPAGRRRLVLDGNTFSLRRNTAAGGDFSTETNDFSVDASSNFAASGNVTAYSDERLKAEWADLPADFIERLAEVRHGTYTRIDSGARQIGVSAQSLQSVAPEGVLAGEYLSVAYGNVALAAAVQLSRRVLELERRLSKLIEE